MASAAIVIGHNVNTPTAMTTKIKCRGMPQWLKTFIAHLPK
jgi:hypothetical protein